MASGKAPQPCIIIAINRFQASAKGFSKALAHLAHRLPNKLSATNMFSR
jgi:hypothetical protein